jgi:hypothetical protein
MPDTPSQLATALGDRYAVEAEFGHRGMETVCRARDLCHNR